MPSILNLKFKGNKSFVAFSNLNDTESLTKTWKVCTKVASFLEQGQRLENLSWRLWHLQNLMVDTDNAKSKREFKKLSKCMGDKLDKEKGRSIEELEAPDFKRNHSTDMIRQRAVEKERHREASQNATPGTIKRMQFTFSVDQPAQPVSSAPVKKPDTRPSTEFSRRSRAAPVHGPPDSEDAVMADDESSAPAPAPTFTSTTNNNNITNYASLRFPDLFNNDFGPSALLYAAPTLTTRMNYGEGFSPSVAVNNDSFSISRPTIELALDDLLFNDELSSDNGSNAGWTSVLHAHTGASAASAENSEASATSSSAGQQQDVVMSTHAAQYTMSAPPILTMAPPKHSATAPPHYLATHADDESASSSMASDDEELDQLSPAPSTSRRASAYRTSTAPLSQAVKDILPETVAPSRVSSSSSASVYGTRSGTPTGRPTLTLRTQTALATRSSGPSATATSLNPAVLRGGHNSAPGGVKAECSNCGATHTPLWRRGLNDELNCNACGLYCKLHKRPRPKSMRNSHGEGRAQAAPRAVEASASAAVDVMGKWAPETKSPPLYSEPVRSSVAAQCYNCHTTATPLWRKDDEGKTVCNACGLYYKLHGSARPISMKSDVIRKRSRHDARRSGAGLEDTPSASPGVSRRTSPVPEASPTLAPDSTTQMTYEFSDDSDFRTTSSSSSELMGALGGSSDTTQPALFNSFQHVGFPGPYHPDYLTQLYSLPADALPFASNESNTEPDLGMSPRSTKRRRMSTDSGSEPPSSAVSFGSYSGDGSFSSSASSSAHSKRASMEFPFGAYSTNGAINQGPALRGSGNTFWHPPMMPQSTTDSEQLVYPPMMSGGGSGGSSGGSSGNSSSAASNSGQEDSPMDYLHHPPMALQDDDSLFSAYLHHDDSNKGNIGHDSGLSSAAMQMYTDSFYH